MQIDVNGIRLELDDDGDGPAVVLLHGWPDDRSLWRNQVAPLVDAGFRVISLDQRGFGASDRPGDVADYALPLLVGDVVGVLDHLSIPRAHLVGHDWGAAVAWVMGSLVPDRVDHLVCLSVGHPAAFAGAGFGQREKSWYMLLFQFEGVAERWLGDDGFRNLRAWTQHPDIESVVARMSQDGALTAGLNWYRANVPAESLVAGPPDLPPVAAPTMGVWSAGDLALVEPSMTGSAAHVAGEWRYERLPEDVGHWIPLDAPDRLVALLRDFLPAPA